MSNLFPPQVDPSQIACCVGVISDTHMPERCTELPTAVFDVFDHVDFIFHAGDVGELWVLDRLGTIALVIAVHGNDETEEAQRELPYQQVICVRNRRLLLCHSHFPDRSQEMASRKGDDWQPKLKRRAEQAIRAKAHVFVYGHSHVPMACETDGVLLINPGAIASGNAFTRQVIQTVAVLFVLQDGSFEVMHVDLAHPDEIYEPRIDWEAGFRMALNQYSESILAPDLEARIAKIKEADFEQPDRIKQAFLRLSHQCWSGTQKYISIQELLEEIGCDSDVGERDRQTAYNILK